MSDTDNIGDTAPAADEPKPAESKPTEQAKAPVWSWNGAILAVRAYYKDVLSAVSVHYEPIIRDGSIIEYYVPGSSNLLAQARIRIGNQHVTDQSGNAYLPIAISDINYPRQQSIIKFQ